MKKISLLAVSFIFIAVFAVSSYAQAGTGKIGWIETAAFGDEKEGATKYINALKALDLEMKPRVAELQGIQGKLKTISDDLAKLQAACQNPAIPCDQKALATKQEEGQKLQLDGEYKKKAYDAAVEAASGRLLGPVSADISKAIQEFAKAKGYSVILDISALAQANVILALDGSSNVTKDFVTFYNARPAGTASTATPK